MRGIGSASRPTGLLAAGVLATVLATGWSAGSPAPPRATVTSCYAFSVSALKRHIRVTTVPPACVGLSHAEVNEAVARAVRTLIGPRAKPAARHAAIRESAYLAHLINTVPPPKPAALVPLPPAPTKSALPLSLAALACWVATAAAGGYLLAGWLRHGGLRRRRTEAGGMPPLIILSHFGLGVAGLAVWIAYVATNLKALAWVGVGVIVPVAGLGMATLIAALPDPERGVAPDAGAGPGGTLSGTAPGNPGTAGIGLTGAEPVISGPPLVTRIAEAAAPGAPGRVPVIMIALHGAFATAAILLVMLAAVGAN